MRLVLHIDKVTLKAFLIQCEQGFQELVTARAGFRTIRRRTMVSLRLRGLVGVFLRHRSRKDLRREEGIYSGSCIIAPQLDSQPAPEPPGGVEGGRTVMKYKDMPVAAVAKEGAAARSNINGGLDPALRSCVKFA